MAIRVSFQKLYAAHFPAFKGMTGVKDVEITKANIMHFPPLALVLAYQSLDHTGSFKGLMETRELKDLIFYHRHLRGEFHEILNKENRRAIYDILDPKGFTLLYRVLDGVGVRLMLEELTGEECAKFFFSLPTGTEQEALYWNAKEADRVKMYTAMNENEQLVFRKIILRVGCDNLDRLLSQSK